MKKSIILSALLVCIARGMLVIVSLTSSWQRKRRSKMLNRVTGVVAVVMSVVPTIIFAEQPKLNWMFVQTVDWFSVDKDVFRVPSDHDILAFTDRPDRLHLNLSTDEFQLLWGDDGAFSDSRPNAVITWSDEGGIHEAGVILKSAFVDVPTRTMNYQFELSFGDELPEHASYASIFVDDYHSNNCEALSRDAQIRNEAKSFMKEWTPFPSWMVKVVDAPYAIGNGLASLIGGCD